MADKKTTGMVEFTAKDVLDECARVMRDPGRPTVDNVRATYVHWIALGAAWKLAQHCATADGNLASVEAAAAEVAEMLRRAALEPSSSGAN
jgi:hypothetical protein